MEMPNGLEAAGLLSPGEANPDQLSITSLNGKKCQPAYYVKFFVLYY